MVGITGRITHGTMTCLWADYIYMAGILIVAVCIFGKRLRLRKSVAGMEKVFLDKMQGQDYRHECDAVYSWAAKTERLSSLKW